MSFFRVIVNFFHFNRANWKAVTFCFITALVFWFFNALNKDYSTNIRLGVNFQFDEERFIPVTPLPNEIFMNVSGNGWDIMRKSLGFNLPEMIIPLERPTEVRKIVGSTLPALLAGQMGNLQINYVVTDTLYVAVDPIGKRRIKVTVDPDQFIFTDGFGRLSPIVVLPDSISLEGAKSILDKVPDAVVLDLKEENINKDFRKKVEVIFPDGDRIKRNPAVVEVIFEVVEWIEVSRRVKLEIENAPATVKLNLVKDSVSCRIQIPKRQVEDFEQTTGNHVAILDLKGVKRGEKKLLPRIIGLPGNAKLLQVDSVSIKLY